MAQGGKEHRMLFDLQRGRRRTAVKVIYAILAVLMGLSLFLVVGSFNITELFNGSGGSAGGEVAKPYEEQAEKLEAKLKKAPEDEKLLLDLTRARVTAGKSMVTAEPTEEAVVQALQQYQLASSAWSEYLKASKKPSAGVAQLMAPALFSLASEGSRTYPEAQSNIEAASQAQKILAQQRPTLNSYSTLALYTYFTGDYKAAETAQAKAAKLTPEKSQREQLEKQMEEVKKSAEKFQQERKRIAAAQKAAAKSNKGNPESLQSPSTTLGGAFGTGTGLAE
jgi:DNA repair exonuclease SbcCD ATPase subunit